MRVIIERCVNGWEITCLEGAKILLEDFSGGDQGIGDWLGWVTGTEKEGTVTVHIELNRELAPRPPSRGEDS